MPAIFTRATCKEEDWVKGNGRTCLLYMAKAHVNGELGSADEMIKRIEEVPEDLSCKVYIIVLIGQEFHTIKSILHTQ